MKKSLLALAVLGAFAGAASAQSSVTLFGVVDLNAQYLNNNGVKQYTMGQDGMNSSRLGFRGVEDLGGGLNASFWLEGAIQPDTGTAGGQSWQRRSTVSLAGGWGEVRLGRDYTSTFWNWTIFDPFGTNGVGAASNFLSAPGVPAGGALTTLVRANNMIGYFLPSGIAGGLYGQLQVAAGENTPGNKYLGGRIGYAAGPFNIAGAYSRTQVTVSAAPPLGGDEFNRNYNVGGSWNFGFLQLMAFYNRYELATVDQNNWYVGAQAPIGAWTLKGTYGRVDRSDSSTAAGNVEGQNANQWALGATYDLSKRTALYGTYARIDNKDGARFCVAGLQNTAGGGCVANENSQGLQLGVKHSF